MIKKVEKYGAQIWCDEKMDNIRRRRCLCLNCKKMGDTCSVSSEFYRLCIDHNIALMVTCCERWEPKDGK